MPSPDSQADEAQLIAAAAGGDVAAFEQIYRRHAGRVYGLCLRLAGGPSEAQDCTQETFITAWRGLAGFRGDSALATWLHRIAVNEVMGRRRRRAIEMRHLADVAAQPRQAVADSRVLDKLERAIARLPDRAREVFVLYRIYGYTHAEVADMLDIAVGTCKAQVHRATKLLSASLGERGPEDHACSHAALIDAGSSHE